MKRILKTLAVMAVIFAAIFLLFRTPDTQVPEMLVKYGKESSQFVTLPNGQKIHLRDEGPKDAPAIILLHGSNSSLHTWEPWAKALKSDYRVITFDQIGHGLTGPSNDGDYSQERFVGDVGRVADHLELKSFVLAGNSMGGWVAVSYAIAHPERVAGLGLLDSSGAPRNEDEEQLYLGAVIASIPVINNIMTQITPRSLVRSSIADAVSDPAAITDETIDRYWELLRYPGNRQAVVDRANTTRGGPFEPAALAALQMPSLIMWGKDDKVTPISGADWFSQHLTNDTRIIYPGIAHLPMEEAPQQTVSDFKKWLINVPFSAEAP